MSPFIRLIPYLLAMTVVVSLSNYLVQFPFNQFGLGELLTWGAFTYPFAFLVNDLTNRHLGLNAARYVVFLGFGLAVALSAWLATPRIAMASGAAFLTAQLLDSFVFNYLRNARWWRAPLLSSLLGSAIDTLLFFGIAFAPLYAGVDFFFGYEDGSLGDPVSLFAWTVPLWMSLALGDFAVKILIALAMLIPYGLLFQATAPVRSRRID